MKKKSPSDTLTCLGNISAQQFLNQYWQKKPLLIRGAFAGKFAPLTNDEILTLIGYDEAESRLIASKTDKKGGRQWQLDNGPFSIRDLVRLKKEAAVKWTVLTQDVQHFSFEAHQLLAQFNFLPQSRIDDLMVSYAMKGGGVGPHFDSYDVFLLQGSGTRRWQISAQKDLTLMPDMPLKILQNFQPEEEWLLEEGDMLYLPPQYAHNGVAETDNCVTWSIGFRAPSDQEILEAFIDDLRDGIRITDRFADRKRVATTVNNHALVDVQMRNHFQRTLGGFMKHAISSDAIYRFTTLYLTQPKSHVTFFQPDIKLTVAAFIKRMMKQGLMLNLRTRMLYDEDFVYVNGDMLAIPYDDVLLFQQFANTRYISPEAAKSASDSSGTSGRAFESLYAFWLRGYWHLANGASDAKLAQYDDR
jgi:50S ribosomal protein L16 3-hydroxylase